MTFAGKFHGPETDSATRYLATAMFAALGLSILASGCAPQARPPTISQRPRAIWVTRWDYKTPADIRRIADNVAGLGLDTIFFQVRGQGTVLYRSRLEPWADEIGGRDPGFDPLRLAVAEAHQRGLALHAWVNIMPGWKGQRPPADPRQLYNAHPDWFLYDRRGQRQPLSNHYVILNPALPEVRDYLTAVCREIVTGYEVDGLHLDYVRFVTDGSGTGGDYPYDARTLRLYRKATGLAPQDDRRRWNRWCEEQITDVVRDLRDMVRRTNSTLPLSAAVLGDRQRGRKAYFQDAETWLRDGLVDAVCPMAYRQTPDEFSCLISDWRAHAHGKPVMPGIGIYNHRSDRASFEQIRLSAQWGDGFALFAYSSLFPSPGSPGSAETRRAQQRLGNLAPLLKRLARDAQGRPRSRPALLASRN